MELLMTMHQCVTRVVRDKVDLDCVQRHDIDYIFHQSADLPIADAGYLESMPMQVYRVLVSAAIAKNHPVPLALLHYQRLDLRPRLVVNRPRIKLGIALGAVIAKNKDECFIGGLGCWRCG